MKKFSLFTLFISAFQASLFALASPTVIWPTGDGYYVPPGTTNQIFQVQTNVNRCGGTATLFYYDNVSGARTFIETKTYYAAKDWNHVDVYFNIPACALKNTLVISFINTKDGAVSAEATRYIRTDAMEIGLTSIMPILQFKCGDDMWDPIIPTGGKVSVNSATAPVANYGGLVYYFNQSQNHKTDQPISQTNNGQGFSPYSLTYMPLSQQQNGGTFKYSIPAGSCDPRGTNFNTMGFYRLDVNSALNNAEHVDGKIIDPDGLFCADKIRCSLPGITFFPLIGPNDVSLSEAKITDVKYYYVNSLGDRFENARMSPAGTSINNGVVLYRKKVCFADLKNSTGTPEVCNYIIRFKVDVVSGYTPEGGKTYTSCYVEYPTTVTPVTAANQVSASDKLTLLLETFNRIKNQLIALPNFTEKMVCDIMFAAVAILGPDLVIEEVVDIKELNEQSVKNNIDFVKNALTSELSGLEFFWKDNLGNIYSDIDEFIYKTGEFKLYSKDLNGVIWQVYSLIIKEKIKDVTFKISDIISEADFGNLKIHLIRA